MAFTRSSGQPGIPSDPVQLYRTLAETNLGPESLWYHQGTVLSDWHRNYIDTPDVAAELPTGSGKTLVAGLQGEYRRRALQERVAYLCVTRQLARQTATRLTDYGIPNVLLIGKVASWNKADRARYQAADAIAVTVYSHVFNSNPALNDAQLLLLDDAHAAESAVAGPWSVQITRDKQENVYLDVLSALADALDPLILARLRTSAAENRARDGVYLASPLGVAAQAALLEQVLAAADTHSALTDSAHHAFAFLRGQLDKCLVYVSHKALLIRPLIPPTQFHPAFDAPARRIYLSATLGAGGELERVFGRPKITRIPIPAGWEKQGTGRRLFCFPEVTRDLAAHPERIDHAVAEVIAAHGRAVVLTPDGRTAKKFVDTCLPANCPTLTAADVEDDLTVFTDKPAAALVMTNRYDGVDLPDNDCRLVVLTGLPARGDLQERFLHGSLGAVEVLQERLRARIMQGAGRATRNAKDYATVLVLGDDLVSYVTRLDIQAALHPEVHAELEFGYRHSIRDTWAGMRENIEIFDEHGQQWREVDQDIVEDRERHDRVDSPGSTELQKAVRHEVAACDAIWQGQWPTALDCIRRVLDALRGGHAPERYAALWHYLAAGIAERLAQQTGDRSLRAAAEKFYRDACAAARGTTWLSNLAAPADATTAPTSPALDPLDEQAMKGVLANATHLAKPVVFDDIVQQARAALLAAPAKPYEAALVTLGQLAGAVPSNGNGNATAAPDAMWIFGRCTWVGWEAKSEAKPEGELGADAVRQAGGHLRFAAGRRGEAAPGDSIVLLMTPQAAVHPSAHVVAEPHVYLVRPAQVVALFDRIVRAWRTARTRDLTTLTVADLAPIFTIEQALPTQWLLELRAEPLRLDSAPE